MNKKKYIYVLLCQLLVLITLFLSAVIFYLASRQGNDGVTLQIFGEGDDGAFYWEQAQNVKQGLDWIRTSIYPLVVGYILKIFNTDNVYVIRLFNSLGFILLAYNCMKLIRVQYDGQPDLFQEKYYTDSKIWTLIFLMCYLSLQTNVHISILRDIWIYLLYIQNIVIGIRILFHKEKKPLTWLVWFATLWLLGEFRAYILVSYILSVAIYFAYRLMSRRNQIRPFIILAIVLLGVYYTFFMDFTVPIVEKSLRDALEYRNSYVEGFGGGSQMGISLTQPNYLFFLFNYIRSFIGNLIGPLPWQVNSVGTLLVFLVEAIPMLYVLITIFRKLSLLTNEQVFIMFHALVWIGLIAVSNDNVGTGTRLRPVAWILFFVTFAVVYFKDQYQKEIKGDAL